jgi:hypothetical protein
MWRRVVWQNVTTISEENSSSSYAVDGGGGILRDTGNVI